MVGGLLNRTWVVSGRGISLTCVRGREREKKIKKSKGRHQGHEEKCVINEETRKLEKNEKKKGRKERKEKYEPLYLLIFLQRIKQLEGMKRERLKKAATRCPYCN